MTVIEGWSVVSPLGIGRKEFAERLRAGDRGRRVREDLATHVGSAGTRTLDRMTLMVIATAGQVLAEYGGDPDPVGLVLGTSTGSVASITAFLRDTFVQERPYFVNPTHFPNTVMNGAAGHTAIWYGLRGLNSTIACGHLTGLAAVRYAARMIRYGYAERLLVGCVEELSAPVVVASRRAGMPPTAEGCAMFLVSAAGVAGGPEVVDFELGMALGLGSERLATAVTTLLRRNGVGAGDLWCASLARGGADEHAALDRALGDGPPRVCVAGQVGDCFSALGAFQLAGLLAAGEHGPALLTAVGADGAVGAALVRT